MEILLIIPRYNLTLKKSNAYTWPLGLGYVSSSMKNAGYSVTVLNLNHKDGPAPDIITEELDKRHYDIVATGGNSMQYHMIKSIADTARIHKNNPLVILGGSIITSEKILMFEALKPDYAVYGEGELTVVDLLKCIENKGDFKDVDGIIFRNSLGETTITKPRALIQNIDECPLPDFDGLGFVEYLSKQYTNKWYYQNYYDNPRTFPVLASRSCPFECTFCYHSMGRGYRMRSMDDMMKEIESAIQKYDINVICIYDDLFSYKRERIEEFCDRIMELNKKYNRVLKWTCQLSVNTMDEALLRKMKNAGCETISYGFESYSEKVLKNMHKPITPKQIDYAMKLTMKMGIGLQANFIFGDPAETKETARTTLDYWKENCKGQISLLFIQPYPGSVIYERCFEKGILKDKLDYITNKMTRDVVVNMTESMTNEEFSALAEEMKALRLKYCEFITPQSVRKASSDVYEVELQCPYCQKNITYQNYYLQNGMMYMTNGLQCRECGMRFNVVSPLMKLLKDTSILPLIEKGYRKTMKILSKVVR